MFAVIFDYKAITTGFRDIILLSHRRKLEKIKEILSCLLFFLMHKKIVMAKGKTDNLSYYEDHKNSNIIYLE